MFAAYRPILSLLRGTAFLLAASGLHGLLLPLRGQEEGFSTAALGLMGTAWAGGFVAGCFFAPRLVRRAGHVRAFGAFAASGAIVALLTGLMIDEYIWILLRAFTGFTMAGAFMVIESWLNEKATNENRGTVFGLYMMVTYASIMAGQMIVAFGDVKSASLFMVAGIFFCLSLIPTAVSTASTPLPLQDVSLDLKGLYANSPVSCVGCFLTGVANGAWGTLGAVYGARIGISTPEIALMMSLVVVAGAAMQLPMGRISDRTDRRFVLAAAAFISAIVGVLTFLTGPRTGVLVITMTAAYGAFAYTLYSLAVAHANDHARPEDFVKVSGGLLLLYGFGTMIGPIIGAALMGYLSPESLFLATALAHFSLAGYTLLRISRRAPVPVEDREAFKTLPSERGVTPEAGRLDPRTPPEPAE
ncbi:MULTISPECIES: MFS transporter [unclassified Mesorhizobium]|jgi:MFS family permease|uniref:MFS transporter n=1 Tax=unclassified Mesorhizobium TaxID=325217 RepID=UPI0008F1D97D|nr:MULTISPECIES: MFS transporter [unclassified Mesorhizobium]RJG43650.1 MFS transporter [Mesorhizobium sp. DCY119]SFT44301.1 Predicted arabinose efflux permease, MFS family [Mesorhizobium sp. YR577]